MVNEVFVLNNKLFRSEVVTGTSIEHNVAMELKNFFQEHGPDQVFLEPVSVMTWYEKECFLETSNLRIKCYSLPYTLSTDIESSIVFADYHGERISLDRSPQGKIVIIPFPPDPDDAKFVVLKLYSAGAFAVVFFDVLPGRYRRIVITGVEGFPFNYGSPPPIPAVSITKEDYLRLFMRRIDHARIYVKTKVEHGRYGYNVITVYNGSKDYEVIYSVHHDHWFTGFSDDLLGLEIMLKFSKSLGKMNNRKYTTILISFTAEESGAPGYSGWYWICGSRKYLENRFAKSDLDNILMNINLDTLFTSNIHVSYNLFLYNIVMELVSHRLVDSHLLEKEHPYFDSFSFTLYGIPSITLHTFQELRVNYHTNLDDGKENDPMLEKYMLNLLKLLHRTINNKSINEIYSFNHLKERFSYNLDIDLPLETRVLLKKIADLHNLAPYLDQSEFIRSFNKNFIKPIASYKINGLFDTLLMPEIMIAIDVLKRISSSKLRKEIIYSPGNENRIFEISLVTMSGQHIKEEVIRALYEFIRSSSIEYLNLLNDIIKSSLRK